MRFEDQIIASYLNVGVHGLYTVVIFKGKEISVLDLCKLPERDYVGVSQ